jgi:hypothetical protein
MEWVAFDAAVVLINLTMPVPSLRRPPGLNRALVDHVYRASSEYTRRPAVSWRVEGVAVTARLWSFAGGWAALADAMDGVYLAVSGVGNAPDGVSLAVLRDGRAYHFDLDQPLYPGVLSASRAAAGGDLRLPERQEWHADQLRLMRDLGR